LQAYTSLFCPICEKIYSQQQYGQYSQQQYQPQQQHAQQYGQQQYGHQQNQYNQQQQFAQQTQYQQPQQQQQQFPPPVRIEMGNVSAASADDMNAFFGEVKSGRFTKLDPSVNSIMVVRAFCWSVAKTAPFCFCLWLPIGHVYH
jgi:hypothetical protein